MSKITARALLAAASLPLLAAAPLAAQGVVAIEGGTVYTMTGAPIEGGTVLIRDGRIAAVGRDVAVPAGARRVDARGKRVTPGLFEPHTRTGLTEVGAIPETNDFVLADRDEDQVMAAFDVADGLNPHSIVIPVTRIAGVTTAVAAPGGSGLIRGKGVVIDLAGDDARDMLVRGPAAMYAALGESVEGASGGARGGATMRLREVLEDARAYARNRSDFERGSTREYAASRLDLQALQPVLQGRLPLVVEAHRAAWRTSTASS
jgi:imidazolonepropionase-like amidohydrolase